MSAMLNMRSSRALFWLLPGAICKRQYRGSKLVRQCQEKVPQGSRVGGLLLQLSGTNWILFGVALEERRTFAAAAAAGIHASWVSS